MPKNTPEYDRKYRKRKTKAKQTRARVLNDLRRGQIAVFYWHLLLPSEIAGMAGMSASTITRIRKGERAMTPDTMSKVAKALAAAGFCVICGKSGERGVCRECEFLLEEGGVL